MEFTVTNVKELLEAVEKANSSSEKTTITIKAGSYEVNETIKLGSNIEIIGEDGVSLYGTVRVDISDVTPDEKGICKIKLKENGITDSGSFGLGPFSDFWNDYDIPKPHMTEFGPSLELYYGEKKMNISRYPEEGFLKIAKALGETPIYFRKEEKSGSKEGVFIPSETEIFDNDDTSNMLLIGYWDRDWATQRHAIESYNKETKVIKLKEPYHCYGYRDGKCYSGEIGGKFYVINALSQVKKPGDWYIDRNADEIYFIPFEGQKFIDVALCENMFEAEGEKNITVKNLEITRCRKSAFHFKNCDNVTVEKCHLHSLGAWGVLQDWCSNSTVSWCHVYNTGGGGIASSGGDRATLTSSGNKVHNNEIHDIAYWHRTYLAAIEINGVNVVVSENKIYDVPHFGVVFQGNEHIIERNYIRNACYEANDAGAIYAGCDFTCRGTIVRYNHFQDLVGFESRGCVAIYFDDGMATAEVYGNTLVNMTYIGIQIGGGRNFDVHDNHFYNVKIAVSFDNRLERWTRGAARQIVHLNEVPYQNEIWKEAYPELYNILDDEPQIPKYNKFYNNIVIGGDGVAMTHEGLEQHFEHHGNTFIPLADNTPRIEHLSTWYYLTDTL